jgi:2-methylcitrate dehydratase PrpD
VSRRALASLWIITVLLAVILTGATLRLATKARTQTILSETVYLTGGSSSIQLHAEADRASPAVAALVRGSAVTVIDFTDEGGQTWYLVQKANMTPGWVHSEHISLDQP